MFSLASKLSTPKGPLVTTAELSTLNPREAIMLATPPQFQTFVTNDHVVETNGITRFKPPAIGGVSIVVMVASAAHKNVDALRESLLHEETVAGA